LAHRVSLRAHMIAHERLPSTTFIAQTALYSVKQARAVEHDMKLSFEFPNTERSYVTAQ